MDEHEMGVENFILVSRIDDARMCLYVCVQLVLCRRSTPLTQLRRYGVYLQAWRLACGVTMMMMIIKKSIYSSAVDTDVTERLFCVVAFPFL